MNIIRWILGLSTDEQPQPIAEIRKRLQIANEFSNAAKQQEDETDALYWEGVACGLRRALRELGEGE